MFHKLFSAVAEFSTEYLTYTNLVNNTMQNMTHYIKEFKLVRIMPIFKHNSLNKKFYRIIHKNKTVTRNLQCSIIV